ncbi:MAG: IS66 family insertion sequence element accessory protein TnpB [Candidatus Riflebacteria bacterium]|nr:IS66 family insertion sequence element accessory protein TnpB [Candidatus Riflebacteria bacterium]
MRKSIDGLSILVAEHFSLDPFSGHLFAFSNRSRSIVKLLLWDKNGFWILHN